MRVGPPRINWQCFRQTAHASLIKTWIINDAKATWAAFTRKKMRLEKNLIDCFANDFEKLVKTSANKETCNFFLISPTTLLSLPPSLRGPRVKINLGGGCTSTGLSNCNDTKSNWVACTSKKMRLEQNLIDCAQ